MTILATKEIKHVEIGAEELNQFAIEIDLDTILTELNSDLPNDINNSW